MSQFHCYAILCSAIKWLSEWAWFITSVHLCSSSSSVLKWDNVLYSLWQVARMTLLSYPQNVSITGVKQVDNVAVSPAQSFQMNLNPLKCFGIQVTDKSCECECTQAKWALKTINFFGCIATHGYYNHLIYECAVDGPAVQYIAEMKGPTHSWKKVKWVCMVAQWLQQLNTQKLK